MLPSTCPLHAHDLNRYSREQTAAVPHIWRASLARQGTGICPARANVGPPEPTGIEAPAKVQVRACPNHIDSRGARPRTGEVQVRSSMRISARQRTNARAHSRAIAPTCCLSTAISSSHTKQLQFRTPGVWQIIMAPTLLNSLREDVHWAVWNRPACTTSNPRQDLGSTIKYFLHMRTANKRCTDDFASKCYA